MQYDHDDDFTQNLMIRQKEIDSLLLDYENFNWNNKKRIEDSIKDIKRSIQEVVGKKRNQFLSSSKTLEAVSPLSVLSRGYSILTKGEKEQVVNSYSQVKIGDELKGKLKEGQILTKVIKVSDEN